MGPLHRAKRIRNISKLWDLLGMQRYELIANRVYQSHARIAGDKVKR